MPAWLFRDDQVGVRRYEPRYLAALTEYLNHVYEIVAPRQINRGGPVILVQIENEYGAYGADKQYLKELVNITRAARITVPLTTIDQPDPQMLADGSVPGVHLTGSFGSRVSDRLQTLREFQRTGPLMCMEFWDGWFDSWGEHHHTTSAREAARELDTLLAAGASVNLYMFHGGTNFGLTNGANDKGRYLPIVTSYDYDAPLDESGNPTEKYFAFREVIAKYADVPEEQPATASTPPTLEASFSSIVPLFTEQSAFTQQVTHDSLPSFDELEVNSGFVLYETTLLSNLDPGILRLGEIRDRAWIYLDDQPLGVLSRENNEKAIALPRTIGQLRILVEDQGRVNYGPRLGEHKGLIRPALIDGKAITSWTTRIVDLAVIPTLPVAEALNVPGPQIARATLHLRSNSNLFLDTSLWGKGMVWFNGFSLGRYWRRGPQQTLFVPSPVTHQGTNELVVLELEVFEDPRVRLVNGHALGHLEG